MSVVTGVLTAGLGTGVAALAWAGFVERSWYAVRRLTLPVLEPGTPPLRVLHLSDLHLLPWQEQRMAFVRACRAHLPGLIVATGDLLGHADAVTPAVEVLGDLADGIPAIAVLGSNDFFGPTARNPLGYFRGPSATPKGVTLDTSGLVKGLSKRGWTVLENERALIETSSGPIDAVGLGDPHIRRDHPERIEWGSGPPAGCVLRLGVVHAPYRRALDALAGNELPLILAGHTHGGQVRVPGIGALVTNCDLPRRQARGLSRYESGPHQAWLHVSAGLGHSMYAPIRFACRPEVTLLELEA